jgi:hypothetical protein
MKRVDWPNSPGWWWVTRKDDRSLDHPRKFTYNEVYFPDDEVRAWRDEMTKSYCFYGPIEKPGIPLRFELTGSIVSADVECAWHESKVRTTLTIDVGDADIPSIGHAWKKFKISFEEIL